jgi:hypothetical protein
VGLASGARGRLRRAGEEAERGCDRRQLRAVGLELGRVRPDEPEPGFLIREPPEHDWCACRGELDTARIGKRHDQAAGGLSFCRARHGDQADRPAFDRDQAHELAPVRDVDPPALSVRCVLSVFLVEGQARRLFVPVHVYKIRADDSGRRECGSEADITSHQVAHAFVGIAAVYLCRDAR